MTQVAVVLAAGKSTRMRSRIPKAAHSIAGRPLLAHVLFAANAALDDARFATPNSLLTSAHEAEDRGSQLVVVLGHEAERVKQALLEVRGLPSYQVALQAAPLGTGDAVRAALPLLTGNGPERPTTVLVLYGDSPLVRPATLTRLLVTHEQAGATVTFLTGEADRDTGYGRIVRDTAGLVRGIIEERHCTPEQLGITEVNSGIYCFQAEWLWSRLSRLESHPSGEYYLTDLVDLAANEGRHIETISAPLNETAGVNDRVELSEAAAILRRRTLDDLMRSGVTIVDPATTDVDCGIRVGMDTTIYPFTVLHGATEIGENCTIGPYSSIQDSLIGDDCTVLGSWLESAVMDAGARVGPMSHLRPGTHLGTGVFLGNFGEIKNSSIGPHVKMHHVGFVGDATVGAGTNIGAGVITANYDGEVKHHTEVGANAFLGCDTVLIAPITVGDDAITGAGAVVTRDVPVGTVAMGIPARVIRHHKPREARHDSQATALAPSGATVEQQSGTRGGGQSGPVQWSPSRDSAVPSPQPTSKANRAAGQAGNEGKETAADG